MMGLAELPALAAQGQVELVSRVSRRVVAGAEGNVFRYDNDSGEVDLVTRSSASPERPADGSSGEPRISATGGVIAFTSYASDLVSSDFNFEASDIFVFVPEPE